MSQFFIYPVLFTIIVVWLTVSKWMYISKIFKDVRVEIIALIFLTILFGVLNQDLLFNDTYRVVADNWRYDYPYFHYFLIHISQFDELPLWNFNVNAGEPLFLYLNHNYLLHIPHLISYIIYPYLKYFLSTSQMFWWSLLGSIWMFSIAMFFLCRSLFNSGYTAVIIFMVSLFSGTSSGVLHQEQIMASLFYIPIILLALHRYYLCNHAGWLILFSLFLGMAMINHYPHLPLYSLFIMCLVGLMFYRKEISQFFAGQYEKSNRNFILLAACFLVTIIMMSPSFLIYNEYSNKISSPYRNVSDVTKGVNYDFISKTRRNNSLNPHTLFRFLFPRSFDKVENIGQASLDNNIFYVGILPILIIIFGGFRMSTKPQKYWLSVVGIILFLGFGWFTFGYYLLFSLNNFFNLQRLPLHVADMVMFPLLLALASFISQYSNKENYKIVQSNFIKTTLPVFVLICGVALFFYKSYLLFDSKDVLATLLDDILLLLFFTAICLKLYEVDFTRAFKLFLFILILTDVGSNYLNTMPKSVLPIDVETKLAISNKNISWSNTFEHFKRKPYITDYHGMIHQKSMIDLRKYTLLKLSSILEFFKINRQIFLGSNSDRRRVHFISESQLNNFSVNFKNIILQDSSDSESLTQNLKKIAIMSSETISNGVLFDLNTKLITKSIPIGGRPIMVLMDSWSENWIVEVDKKPRILLRAGPFKAVHLEQGDKQVVFRYNPWWRSALMLYLHLFFGLLFFNLLWIYWHFLQITKKSFLHS
jgi:hypothetical protein